MENKAELLSERFLNFGVAIVRLVKTLGNDPINKHISLQVFRSATSVGANYEEARGAESRQDFSHKMQIVLKEARESLFWLKLIKKSELIEFAKLEELINENQQICDIVAKSVKTLKTNKLK